MSESDLGGGKLQDFTIDQFAGAFALSMGAIGTLLLVVWQSRCLCKCRLGFSDKCYLFDCAREPPLPDPEKAPKGVKSDKKSNKLLPADNSTNPRTPTLLPEPEPEPEPEP